LSDLIARQDGYLKNLHSEVSDYKFKCEEFIEDQNKKAALIGMLKA
jgi:hypothetical protein